MNKDANFSYTERILYEYKTYAQGIRTLQSRTIMMDEDLRREKIEFKSSMKSIIENSISLFDNEELIIWRERYIRGRTVPSIYDEYGWSKTTYFRIRKRLVYKVMKCLGLS